VTWLYGPMQPASNRFSSQQNSAPASRLSKTNSFVNGVKKPILKKRSMSEAMLQRSISSSSLVKQAAESVQAQQTTGVTLESRKTARTINGGVTPDFPTSSTMSAFWEPNDYFNNFSSRSTSGLHTPSGEKRHIRFDDKVEQCIALECKEGDDDEEDFNRNPWVNEDESSSDEGVVMMKRARRKKPLSRTSSKTNVTTTDNKTIAKLPSTTLKYRTDSPDITEQTASHSLLYRSSRLSPSPSQETLKPSNPSRNFLLEEDDEDNYFDPGSAFGPKRPATPTANDPYSEREGSGGLRRTSSGMYMPFDPEEEEPPPPGFFGKVVDTVNTARDIAHVVWNAGWRAQ